MKRFIVTNGDKVTIDFGDKHIDLYINEREPLGFQIQMIYKKQNYLDVEKEIKPLLAKMVEENKENIKKLSD